MATLILTAVGTAIGGPIGGIIGAMAGNYADSLIFSNNASRTVEGPRLKDLAVQSSAYGAPIPLVYGTARLAGNIIWSTGLIETRREDSAKVSGGKGGGRSQTVTNVSYTYASSFAVALCGRAVHDIRRIWADGKLLRDEAGAVAASCALRIYLGDEDQLPDPLIEAHELSSNVPAFRGVCYVVFENLQLAEYANRIPNLTFEIVADSGGVASLGHIVSDLAGRSGLHELSVTDMTSDVSGFIIGRPTTARAAIEPLARTFMFDAAEVDNRIVFASYPKTAAATLADSDLAAHEATSKRVDKVRVSRAQELDLPREVSVEYIDPARDYQAGVQRARRLSTPSQSVNVMAMPMVLSADRAKQAAEVELARSWQDRGRYDFSVSLKLAALAPGDVVNLPVSDVIRQVAIDSIEFGGGVLQCSGRGYSSLVYDSVAVGDVGSLPGQVIAAPGNTILHLLDLPSVSSSDGQSPVLYMAAAGETAAWSGAVIYVSDDGGGSYQEMAVVQAVAVMGTVESLVEPGPTAFWDEKNSISVMLVQPLMELESRSALAILNGGNAALVGDEIIQFREAVLEVDGSYTLKGLLRGRRGTEYAMSSHAIGERFILLEGGRLTARDTAFANIGRSLLYKALSSGQAIGEVTGQTFTYHAHNLKPFAPVHLQAVRNGAGDITVSWVRRARLSGEWRDHVDVALDEAIEAYELEILSGGDVVRMLTVGASQATYTSAQQTTDFGAPQTSVSFRLYQVSQVVGRGWPASAIL